MRERVLLNDQGLYVDCIVENGRISFEFESGLETLNDKVQLYKDGSVTYGLLGLKRFIRISKERISRVMRITTTEARMLCALSHRVDDLFKRKIIKDKSLVKEFYRNLKELYALPKGWNDKQIHHTELHTHFIEILNAEEFIKFINNYNVTYPINEEGNLDFKKGTPVSYQELVSLGYKEKLINSLRLDITKQSEFSDLTDVVNNNRRSLLQRIIDHNYDAVMKDRENEEFISSDEDIKRLEKEMDEITSSDLSKKEKGERKKEINKRLEGPRRIRKNIISNTLYDDLLVTSLDKLRHEKVGYTEISFSNANRLKHLSEEHEFDDSFNLLYSIRREKSIEDFRKASEEVEELLNTSKVIGIDIMGHEEALVGKELDDFRSKMMWLLPVLHLHPNSLLRIHASEFKDTSNNMLQTLKTIEDLTRELNDACGDIFGRDWGVVPPPRIRIGHGANIIENPELVRLIKKYDVVVEINASSNYALGNIKSIRDLPLDFYKKNKIKYVISTDGGGVYSTSILQEENLLNERDNEVESEEMKKGLDGVEKPSVNDRVTYEGLKPIIEIATSKKDYKSYEEALGDEKEKQGSMSNQEFVNREIQNLEGYIMDMDPDYDQDYYREMKSIIIELNNKDKTDIAKTYLYLLERELFSERETAFKTLHYLDKVKKENNDELNNNLINDLIRLYNLIEKSYMMNRESILHYYNDNGEVKRR